MRHIVLLCAASLAISFAAHGQGFGVPWSGVGTSGGTSSAGGTSASSTVGTPISGSTAGGGVGVTGGFMSNPAAGGGFTDVEFPEVLLPVAVRLLQNYPNPFNPETIIRFDLPATGRAVLAVYDILGREVARPIDGLLDAGGHEVLFSARGFASGVYVYRLTTEGVTASRRMIILR